MKLEGLKGIPYNFSVAKRAVLLSSIVAITSVLASFIWSVYITMYFAENAYVISDKGVAAMVKRNDSSTDDYRLPEIKNHIRVFHELFWSYDQFSFSRNMEKALEMIGNSGKEMYLSLKANGHFSNIQAQNLVQKIVVDSINVDDTQTPYKAAIYGKLQVKRTDQDKETLSPFMATMDLINVTRTEANPHGLLIENYMFNKTQN